MNLSSHESVCDQDPILRKMELKDIPMIHQIEQESFTSPWSAQAFEQELTRNHFAYYLVLEYEGEIAGYGGMWVVIDEAHVTNIAVRSAYRRRKWGELLLKKLMEVARSRACRGMTLEVRVSNHIAQNLYRKLGFKPSGTRKQYYSDNHEDALIMWVDL